MRINPIVRPHEPVLLPIERRQPEKPRDEALLVPRCCCRMLPTIAHGCDRFPETGIPPGKPLATQILLKLAIAGRLPRMQSFDWQVLHGRELAVRLETSSQGTLDLKG